jgi:hypothetical protein
MKAAFISLGTPLSFPNLFLSFFFLVWSCLALSFLSMLIVRQKPFLISKQGLQGEKAKLPRYACEKRLQSILTKSWAFLFLPYAIFTMKRTALLFRLQISGRIDFVMYGAEQIKRWSLLVVSCRVVLCTVLLCPIAVPCLVLSCLVCVLSCFAFSCHALSFVLFCRVWSWLTVVVISIFPHLLNVPDHLFCEERFEGVRFLSNRSFPQFEGKSDVAHVAFASPCFRNPYLYFERWFLGLLRLCRRYMQILI